MRSALHAAHLDPTAVTLLEMHGTGTSLGDPIEMGAATAVLLGSTDGLLATPHLLCLSAVKSCVGHT